MNHVGFKFWLFSFIEITTIPFSLPLEAAYLLRRTDEAASIIQQKFRKIYLKSTFTDVVDQAMVASNLVNEECQDEEQAKVATTSKKLEKEMWELANYQ